MVVNVHWDHVDFARVQRIRREFRWFESGLGRGTEVARSSPQATPATMVPFSYSTSCHRLA